MGKFYAVSTLMASLAGAGAGGAVAGDHGALLSRLDAARFFWEEDADWEATLRAEVAKDGVRALYGSRRIVLVDPEALAECGIGDGLMQLGATAARRGFELTAFSQSCDAGYDVRLNGKDYEVYSEAALEQGADIWGLAVEALVTMVNDNIAPHSVDRLHFFGGGNDGFCMFLPPEVAPFFYRADMPRSEWPYVPDRSRPGLGRDGLEAMP